MRARPLVQERRRVVSEVRHQRHPIETIVRLPVLARGLRAHVAAHTPANGRLKSAQDFVESLRVLVVGACRHEKGLPARFVARFGAGGGREEREKDEHYDGCLSK